MRELISRTAELSAKVKLCGERSIEMMGQVFQPDKSTAFVEFYLSHAFPVTTVDHTGIHPQVVANSYRSMLYKVFDLAHIMKKYDPKNNPRDRILGTIVAVEFPEEPKGGWKVQGSRASAPGIHALACMHRAAEQVDQILAKHFSGEMNWTVSMEQDYYVENSGFLIAHDEANETAEQEAKESKEWERWEDNTPRDMLDLGWVYVPAVEAPLELLKCFDAEESRITKKYLGNEVVILFGGLDGMIHYKGVGLTPLGKEKEAEVAQMLAGKKVIPSEEHIVIPDIFGLLKETAEMGARVLSD